MYENYSDRVCRLFFTFQFGWRKKKKLLYSAQWSISFKTFVNDPNAAIELLSSAQWSIFHNFLPDEKSIYLKFCDKLNPLQTNEKGNFWNQQSLQYPAPATPRVLWSFKPSVPWWIYRAGCLREKWIWSTFHIMQQLLAYCWGLLQLLKLFRLFHQSDNTSLSLCIILNEKPLKTPRPILSLSRDGWRWHF